jgi:hypothetical protein
MKKIFAIFIVGVILLGVTVFAQDTPNTLDQNVQNFVKDVAQTKGVNSSDIAGVKELDMNNLPKEVNIKNIDNNNLALYEINVTNESKPVYVVTASSKFFKQTVKKYAQRMLLAFGFNGDIMASTFLKTSVGVTTSLQKGYVMTRDGSISGLSTNLEVVQNDLGAPIEVTIYKNSQPIGFRNSFTEKAPGVYSDYDTASGGAVTFQKGDVISLKIDVPGNAQVKDVTSLLEIETE